MIKVLDVGCGPRPLGDVNVDIYKGDGPQSHTEPCDVHAIPNFVQASGCHLPFKTESFETVISDSTMEHVTEYFLFLTELLRVSKNNVTIKVPHRFSSMNRNPESHKQYFTVNWFINTLTKLGLRKRGNFEVHVTRWNYFPHQFLPWIRTPRTITVEIYKQRMIPT